MNKFDYVLLGLLVVCVLGLVYMTCLATQKTQSRIDFCMEHGYDIGYIGIGEYPIQACVKDLGDTYCTRRFIDLSPMSFNPMFRFQDQEESCENLEGYNG